MRTSITLGTSGTIELFDEIPISTTYQIADIKNPETRKGSHTKTINIPGSKTNDKLFAHIFEIDIDCRFNPNIRTPCVISIDGLEQLNGYLKLIRIKSTDDNKKEYECSVFGNVSNIFTVMGATELTALNMSEFDHVYNKTNQKASWTATIGEGYVYPLIDYGYSNGLTYDVQNFFPAIYVKEYIDKIFSYTGFTYESNFFNSDLFKRLIIPFNTDALRLSDASVVARLFNANIGSSGTIDLPNASFTMTNPYTGAIVPYNAETVDNSNQFNTSTYKFVCSEIGNFNLSASFNYQLNTSFSPNPSGWILMLRYSGGSWTTLATESFATFGGISDTLRTAYIGASNIGLYPGDEIHIGLQVLTGSSSATPNLNLSGGAFYNSVNNTGIFDGNEVSMNRAIPQKIKMKEFFMSLVKMFNLYIETDKLNSNKLYIEPRNDFYSSGVVKDWTSKLDLSQPLDIEPMGELDARKYIFTYSEDKDFYNELYKKTWLESYGTYNKDVNNEFITGNKETKVIFSATPLVNDGGTDRTIPEIYTTDSAGNIKPKVSNIRILYYAGTKTTTFPWAYTGAISGTTTETTFPYAGHLDDITTPTIDLSFGVPREVYYEAVNYTNNQLYNAYYKKFVDEISDKDSKVVTGYFYLTPVDIFTLDFRNEFFVDGHFLRLNKIYDYDPVRNQLTKCEFLKIKNAQSFTGTTGGLYSQMLDVDFLPNPVLNERPSTGGGGGSARMMGNFISPSAVNSFASGTRNCIGAGTSNISLINSSGCTVLAGVNGVTLINTSGVTVSESGVTYINGALQQQSTPKIYKASLNQSGTSAPTKTEHVNTLGVTITASYVSVGVYRLTASSPVFLEESKTYIDISNGLISPAGGGDYNIYIAEAYWVSTTIIEIGVGNTFTGGDLSNGGFYNTPILIEVYT